MADKSTDKREAILQASLEIFAENGFHSSPTSAISKKANVGIGTIYRYFENKDALIEALHEEIEEKLRPITYGDVEESAPVRENILRVLKNLFRFMLEHPDEFKFLEQYYNSPYGIAKKRSKAEQADNPLQQLLSKGIEQQIIKDLQMEILFGLCFGPIVFLARDQMTGYYELNEELMLLTINACWDSLRS